jgi:predicted GIY-YIG superfamily endonuclease
MQGCYLLHFIPRFKHAGHYLGYADDIGRRVYEHEFGKSGVRLITAAVAAGVQLHLVRTWEGGDRTLERQLKGRAKGSSHLPRLCPICKEEKRKCQNK